MVEGSIASGYAVWRKKPLGPILLTSITANLITQSLLWIGLNLFFREYLFTLLAGEILIWLIESFLLNYFPANRLGLWEAVLLALLMNLGSFAIGWFLPV